MTTLADNLVPDELWAIVEPLRRRRRVRPTVAATAPSPTGPASPQRRLTEWAKAGVFDQLHLEVLDRLGEQGRLDWSRASVDSASVRAKRGGTTWAQIRSIAASLEASSTWSATAAGCP
jgi:transposase